MPDLTYFIGRPYVTLEVSDTGPEWSIVLDGDSRITNVDENIESPPTEDLIGTQFIRPIFSESETWLQFGTLDEVKTEIALNPLLYTISDPTWDTEEPIYPQVIGEPVTLPPDPSDERVADGPYEEPEQKEGTENDA